MARLLLLRHGESTWNAEGRWQGWADPALSDSGREQAQGAVADLADAGPGAVVSSDLERARGTARIVADALKLTVEVEAALRERDVGAWSGLTADEIEQGWPGALAAWRAGRLASPPEGETDAALGARALEALRRLAARPEGCLLVVTHGGVIRVVERHFGLQPSRTPNLSGRWVHAEGTGLVLGSSFLLPDSPESGWGPQPVVAEARSAE